MYPTKIYAKIVNGPDKERLCDAWKYACDRTVSIPLRFTLSTATNPENPNGTTEVDLHLRDLTYEDGSGYSFNLHGGTVTFLESHPNSSGNYIALFAHPCDVASGYYRAPTNAISTGYGHLELKLDEGLSSMQAVIDEYQHPKIDLPDIRQRILQIHDNVLVTENERALTSAFMNILSDQFFRENINPLVLRWARITYNHLIAKHHSEMAPIYEFYANGLQ